MKKILLLLISLCFMVVLLGQSSDERFISQTNGEFAKTIMRDSVQIVDVRTAGEFAAGHIPGAVNMDVSTPNFEQQASKLRERHPVAVYCRSGARSKQAARKLAAMGYTVYELNNGFMGWNGQKVK